MKYIQIEPLEDICLLRINRPEALNAMNTDVIAELSRSIDIVGFDDSIRVVIITGSGEKSFCAGADIAYMVNIDPMKAEKYAASAQAVLNKIEKLDKPVIAAVNGFALGGGCELSMVAIASDEDQLEEIANSMRNGFKQCELPCTTVKCSPSQGARIVSKE